MATVVEITSNLPFKKEHAFNFSNVKDVIIFPMNSDKFSPSFLKQKCASHLIAKPQMKIINFQRKEDKYLFLIICKSTVVNRTCHTVGSLVIMSALYKSH